MMWSYNDKIPYLCPLALILIAVWLVELQMLSYHERASLCTHPLTKRLFTIMAYKKTNLALSADVTSAHQVLQVTHLTSHGYYWEMSANKSRFLNLCRIHFYQNNYITFIKILDQLGGVRFILCN